ncbi:saccharopine dehydrogenase [Cavenderia fasciculata]|uniref:Saccharopine dehydrogenase n=1 Tax=Cavenderia fasciculata TaxID=261658 RepID=F4PVT8_CACFS|nr:saccharopine dehydrogenase [Cavenderia fasciculata]EGG20102.1 saccharopine dehydrogenase [Cavenderia fasciculata]|eukprot:XP_004367085.1 saccharopine dehydrogenase [Cavenderia fasciculata]
MLKSVIIITGNGTLLFEKIWVSSSAMAGKGNMFSSLLTTVQEFSKQSTGMFVSYVEFGHTSITIVYDEKSLVRCCLFHDEEDGPEFGKLIANSLLRGFLELYSDTDFTHPLHNTSKFSSFSNKIYDSIANSPKSVLYNLRTNRGIQNAIVVYADGTFVTTGSEDQLGMIANLQAMLSFSNDILLSKGDRTKEIILDMITQRVFISRVGPANLVCICKKNKDPSIYQSTIYDAVTLLDKGSGFVAKPAVDYLLKRDDVHITVLSLFKNELERISKQYPASKITTVELDILNNIEELNTHIPKSQVVISLLPATFHVQIAKMCIEHKVHYVTASYISPEMRELDGTAKEAGVLLLNELGLDPGIDHMSAMKIIDSAKEHKGKVTSFVSWCGALPEKECSNNPFGYKFSWSPRGVLSSAALDATFLWDKITNNVPSQTKFSVMQPVDVTSPSGEILKFEGVANRDSFPYIKEYHLVEKDIETMFRGTLRWDGFSVMVRALRAIGLFSTENDARIASCSSWRAYLVQLLGCNDNDSDLLYCLEQTIREYFVKNQADVESHPEYKFPVIKRDIDADVKQAVEGIRWLDMLEASPADETSKLINKLTPIDSVCALLEKKLAYKDGERDLVVLQHELVVVYPEQDNRSEKEYSQLICYGQKNGSSATSLTVGLPVGIATELILDNEVKALGCIGPVTPEFYNPILERLQKEGIQMTEYKNINVHLGGQCLCSLHSNSPIHTFMAGIKYFNLYLNSSEITIPITFVTGL